MRRILRFIKTGIIALAVVGAMGCFEEEYSPPAYYGGGPGYVYNQPEYVPYYAGRPQVRNYYYDNDEASEHHWWSHRDSDNTFHRTPHGWRNSEGETPRHEWREHH